MGNGCVCIKDMSFMNKDIRLDMSSDNKYEGDQMESTNLYNNIMKYFNDGEKEINTKIEQKKMKRMLSHKKHKKLKTFYKMDEKYELILQRLLEQKVIERKGPKRRETIRNKNSKNFIKLVQEVMEENKGLNKNNSSEDVNKNNSILLNKKEKKINVKFRQSVNMTKYELKKIKNDFGDTEINNLNILKDIKVNDNYNSKQVSNSSFYNNNTPKSFKLLNKE
jgi:hypothetical protein